jgi:uncharacterized protein
MSPLPNPTSPPGTALHGGALREASPGAQAAGSGPAQPWYRHPITWLVVALPLIAVVASFITLFVALANPDPVVKPAGRVAEERPAVEGRNHAATGGFKTERAAPGR